MSNILTEDQKKIRNYWIQFWKELNFHVGTVGSNIMENIKLEDIKAESSPIEWLPIRDYSLTNQIINRIKKENKFPASPLKFLGSVSKMKAIDNIKVCLFLDGEKWVAFVAMEEMQRTISFLNTGDGWNTKCEFAVESTQLL